MLGETLLERATVPVNPPTLVSVIVDEPDEPRLIARLFGLAAIAKLELALVGTVSGTGNGVPFATVTQTPLLTLVFVQPVWKFMTVPEVVAAML